MWFDVSLATLAIVSGLRSASSQPWQSRPVPGRQTRRHVHVELIRNTPFLVQVFFIYFGLPALGISFEPWSAAVLALSLNNGAFSAEVIRGGIEAIPRGQYEAGAALGLKPLQVFSYIVLKPPCGSYSLR